MRAVAALPMTFMPGPSIKRKEAGPAPRSNVSELETKLAPW
jgi:hypothetical protein